MISRKISWWHISVIRVIQVVKVIQLIQVMRIYDPTFESFLFSNQHCWTGDGCNSVICDCSVDAKNAKTGKVFCVKTKVGCDPPNSSKDSGGEFPIFQNLFLCVLFLYKTYSKQTNNLTTLFHVTARSAKKGSTGKRLPVSVFAKKHFLTDFSSNQQVMAATQLIAIVTLMLRMLKPA